MTMKFADINLRSIGNTVQLVGGVWAGDGHAYVFYLPEFGKEFDAEVVEMTAKDWEALLQQSDLVETEVLAKAQDGSLYKAVIRKCQRAVDQNATWNVYRRDQFKCRYCGNDQVPLTVDHVVLWEEGGPSTEENMVTACRKCNKVRGNIQYADWMKHRYYLEGARNLDPVFRQMNEALIESHTKIQRRIHVRNR